MIEDPDGKAADAEQRRLDCLRRYGLDGTPGEPDLDRIVRFAAELFGVPICAITLVGKNEVWLRARFGVEIDSSSAKDPSVRRSFAAPCR